MASAEKSTWFRLEVYSLSKCSFTDKKIVKVVSPATTIGDVIAEYVCDGNSTEFVHGITKKEESHPVDLPYDLPAPTAASDFDVNTIRVTLRDRCTSTPVAKVASILDVMMTMARNYDSLPEKKQETTQRNKLYNSLIDTLVTLNAKFKSGQLTTVAKYVVNTITDALWYCDPHWDKFATRGILMPQSLTHLRGFNDFRTQKKKMPRVCVEDLQRHAIQLSDIVSIPWFQRSGVLLFHKAVSDLCSCIIKYHEFLQAQQRRTEFDLASPDYVRFVNDAWDMRVIEKGLETVSDDFKALYETLDSKKVYEGVCLESFGPQERYERRRWFENLQMPFPMTVWSYSFGNKLGTIRFVWKLPVDKSERSSDKDIDLVSQMKSTIPKHASRKMKRDFIGRYLKVPGMHVAILRNIYTFLTDDASTATSGAEAEVNASVSEFLADSGDPELFWDLRRLNGKPHSTQFDAFWDELGNFLDEKSAVHERRHGDHLYMPLAMSVSDLREIIMTRLPSETPIPSESWIRLNFWPSNAYCKTAMYYTGRFKVKFVVQQRLTRAQHVDAKFCGHQFSLLKGMAVKWRDHMEFFSMDDKAIVPVGEPKKPLSTGVRAHHGSLIPSTATLSALDHDFHICGLVPSVAFHITIPEYAKDSFYDGKIHVTLKDKIFQPSNPLRHGAELVELIRNQKDDDGNHTMTTDGLNLHVPILAIFTDGGPDHRTTYRSVQMALVAVFLVLDLDMLIAATTAPYQSYSNPVERSMSLLNLGLQNVAISRDEMDAKYELMMNSLGTITQVRQRAEKTPDLKESLRSAMEPVMTLLQERFSRLKWKEEPVQIHTASTEEEIEQLLNSLLLLDNSLDLKTINKDCTALSAFFEQHCRQRHYIFQVKKCGTCPFCTLSPPRLPDELFKDLYFVPDPVLDGDSYKDFNEVYGKPTEDSDRPSLKDKLQTNERDKKFKTLLVAAKARNWIPCVQCQKRRVIYCDRKMDRREELAVARVKEEMLFSCGCSLFQESDVQ